MMVEHDLQDAAIRREQNGDGETTWKLKISTVVTIILCLLTLAQGAAIWWVSSMKDAQANDRAILMIHESRISKGETQAIESDKRIDGVICDIQARLKIFDERQMQMLMRLGITPKSISGNPPNDPNRFDVKEGKN